MSVAQSKRSLFWKHYFQSFSKVLVSATFNFWRYWKPPGCESLKHTACLSFEEVVHPSLAHEVLIIDPWPLYDLAPALCQFTSAVPIQVVTPTVHSKATFWLVIKCLRCLITLALFMFLERRVQSVQIRTSTTDWKEGRLSLRQIARALCVFHTQPIMPDNNASFQCSLPQLSWILFRFGGRWFWLFAKL